MNIFSGWSKPFWRRWGWRKEWRPPISRKSRNLDSKRGWKIIPDRSNPRWVFWWSFYCFSPFNLSLRISNFLNFTLKNLSNFIKGAFTSSDLMKSFTPSENQCSTLLLLPITFLMKNEIYKISKIFQIWLGFLFQIETVVIEYL